MNRKYSRHLVCLTVIFLIAGALWGKTKNAPVPPGTTEKLSILLLKNNNGGAANTADGALVLYNNNYSAFIGQEDSYKFKNSDESMAIFHKPDTLLSIEGKPRIVSADTIRLSMLQLAQTSYIFKFDGTNFSQDLAGVLKDAYLNTETAIDLSASTLIPFTVNANAGSFAEYRFSIIITRQSKPVTITSSPANATSCAGGNSSFTVAASGFYLIYQWQVSTDGGIVYSNITDNALYSGGATNTLNITGATNAMKGYLYRVVINGESPISTATSMAGKLSIANTWTGSLSPAWNNAQNWYCAIVPVATDDIIIPSASANMPALLANTVVNSITLQGNSSLTIGSNILTVNGLASGSGSLSGSPKSDLTVNGSGTISFTSGKNLLRIFTISSPSMVSLASDLGIDSLINVTAGTFDLASHAVTLRAGTKGEVNYNNTTIYPNTATAGPVGGNIVYGVAGKFIIERYIPAARRAFRFMASSVTTTTSIRENWMENGSNNPGYGTHITGYQGAANGFDPTITNNPSLFAYNNTDQAWGDVKSTANTLVAGDAYRLFVRGDRTVNIFVPNPPATATILRTAGILRTGTVNYASPFLKGTTGPDKTYNFIGNPYASPVKWSSLTKTGISATYWSWDPNINTRGAYVNYVYFTNSNGDFTGGVNNTDTASKVDNNLQPGQAFFIECTGPNPSLTFHEADKSANTTAIFRTPADMAKLSVQLLLSTDSGGSRIADGSLAIVDSMFSRYISSEDAIKFNNPDENIAIMQHDTALSVQGRPCIDAADTVFLKLWQFRQKEYYLKVNTTNFLAGISVYVTDAYLGAETAVDLSTGLLLPFSITADSASFAPSRFMIVFRQSAVLPLNITGVRAYTKDKGIQVSWTAHNETNIDHYDIEKSQNATAFIKAGATAANANGRLLNTYNWLDENPYAGENYYRLKVVERSGGYTYSTVVSATTGSAGPSITVSPNPIKNNELHLLVKNLEEGNYLLKMYSASGQQVYATNWNYDGISSEKSFFAGRLATGIYTLQISKGNKTITQKIIR